MGFYDMRVNQRDDTELQLDKFEGKVVLIVNTATGCGFTPQYEALEKLYETYHSKGLEILDFPCNQFGHQAPGSDDEIHDFCTAKYQTTFDQLNKVDVNGPDADPVFNYLKENSPEEYISGMKNKMAMAGVKKLSTTCKEPNDIVWNFTKFLVDGTGRVIMRVSPIESPMVMEDKIKELLGV